MHINTSIKGLTCGVTSETVTQVKTGKVATKAHLTFLSGAPEKLTTGGIVFWLPSSQSEREEMAKGFDELSRAFAEIASIFRNAAEGE